MGALNALAWAKIFDGLIGIVVLVVFVCALPFFFAYKAIKKRYVWKRQRELYKRYKAGEPAEKYADLWDGKPDFKTNSYYGH